MSAAPDLLRGAARPLPPPDFAERAAILEYEADMSRKDAENAAARALGFKDAGAWALAVALDWRAHVLTARPQTEAGRQAVADALTVIREWGDDLAIEGWCEGDLFGRAPLGKPQGLVFQLRGGFILGVTEDHIKFRSGAAGRLTLFRAGDAATARPM